MILEVECCRFDRGSQHYFFCVCYSATLHWVPIFLCMVYSAKFCLHRCWSWPKLLYVFKKLSVNCYVRNRTMHVQSFILCQTLYGCKSFSSLFHVQWVGCQKAEIESLKNTIASDPVTNSERIKLHKGLLEHVTSSWVQSPILTISSNLAIVAKLGDPKCL